MIILYHFLVIGHRLQILNLYQQPLYTFWSYGSLFLRVISKSKRFDFLLVSAKIREQDLLSDQFQIIKPSA